jgi:hypothetical protein
MNLYGFVQSSPISNFDILGLAPPKINVNELAYGEIGTWGIKHHYKDLSAPTGLGDAKVSMAAVAARGQLVATKKAPGANAGAVDKAVWNNISNAKGSDKSGGAKHYCINVKPPCGIPNKCATCYSCPKKNKWVRGSGTLTIVNTGTVTVGSDKGGIIYFFNFKDENKYSGWCTRQDQLNSYKHTDCTKNP